MGGSDSKPEPRQPSPPPPSPWCPKWRDIRWDAWDDMLTKCREYQTELESVPKVNLLLVGSVGSGKSSFVNTIDSMFKGRTAAAQEAMSATSGEASITRQFSIKKPGGRKGGEVGFNVCDTMGMEQQDGLNMDDLLFVLDGNVPHGFRFHANQRITPSSPGFISNPTWKEKMHCLAYVVDGTKVHMAPGEIKEKFQNLRALASARGIRVVILVTHIDQVCGKVKDDVRNAHKSVAVKRTVDKINNLTGIPIGFIFLVKNYCEETEIDDDVNALDLTALRKMLDFADDILDDVDK